MTSRKRSSSVSKPKTPRAQAPNRSGGDAPVAQARPVTLGALAELVRGVVEGDRTLEIRGVSGIREAGPGEITFLSNPRYARYLETTRAAAVIVDLETGSVPVPALRCSDPYRAFLQILEIFARRRPRPLPGLHPTAILGRNVELGREASVGPHAVVEDGVRVGARTILEAGVFVGRDTRIGSDCRIYPRVVIREETEIGDRVIVHPGAVIGADGFGFILEEGSHRKIPQIGRVVIEDDVEVGANTTIDRATVGETRVRRGARIDNLVQVAHNVSIGEHSILCAQVGISGSTEVGRGVTLAGQVGIVGHIRIGDGVQVGAQAGVTKSIPDGQEVSGYPAMQHALARRVYAALRHLPEALQRLRELRERLERLERRMEEGR